MDKTTLTSACVELVTVNGRPFTILQDSGFKKIVDPIIESIGGGKYKEMKTSL